MRESIYYRGFNNNEQPTHLLWFTDDIEYAKEYGSIVMEYIIDEDKLEGSLYDIDEILGYELDICDGPTKEESEELLNNGINSYEFEGGDSNCICLWDKTPIISKKIISSLNEGIINDKIKSLRKEINTNPTEKQVKAGNYKMAHISINGFGITIENPKGSYRKGKDKNGKLWKTLMHNDYGYFTKTKGKDGDAIDVFLGPYLDDDIKTAKIYPIDQYINGEFDETKIMMGFRDKESAKSAYLSNYSKDWKGFKYISEVDYDMFKKWLYDGYRQRKPFAKYVSLCESKTKKNDEGKIIPEKCDKCGGDIHLELHGEPIYICHKCGKYFGVLPFSKKLKENFDAASRNSFKINSETLDDYSHIIDEEINNAINSVDFTSFIPQKGLNNKIWNNGIMNSKVRMRLMEIAEDFISTLETDNIKPKDVILTGSLANYNWSKYSDFDLHVVYDFSDFSESEEMIKDYFNAKKNNWNNKHDELKIYDFPVELYVQDSNEKHTSSGIYSLFKNEWIIKPEKNNFRRIKMNKTLLQRKFEKYKNIIDNLESDLNNIDINDDYNLRRITLLIEKITLKIQNIRKEALKIGELSNGNIFYKILRRCNYLNKLRDLKNKSYDKLLSLK